MLLLHAQRALIIAVIAANGTLAIWAYVVHRRGQRTVSRGFWTVLLIILAFLIVQVASGIALLLSGARPRGNWPLHLLYGVLVGALAVYQVGLRPGGFVPAQHILLGLNPRSPSGLALICLMQAALIARAYATGIFGR